MGRPHPAALRERVVAFVEEGNPEPRIRRAVPGFSEVHQRHGYPKARDRQIDPARPRQWWWSWQTGWRAGLDHRPNERKARFDTE